MEKLYLEKIKLTNIGPYSDLLVNFKADHGINIICGNNGVGKTTLLESIICVFSLGKVTGIRKKQGSTQKGLVEVFIKGLRNREFKAEIDSFEPEEKTSNYNNFHSLSRSVIYIKANRDFNYIRQDAIKRDPASSDNEIASRIFSGLNADQIKGWFTNRYLMKPHANTDSWTPDMLVNLEDAEKYISLLDPEVQLDRVDVKTFDIIVRTPTGVIPFEYLSSGFKSAYVLLLGIIKEIEFRSLGVSARNFSGLIIIDELDLHLHPSWQREIGGALKRAFPKAQIIASTHSPHIVQAAEPSEVIALVRDKEGVVRARPIPSSEYGYAGWTLEEVLQDVMGVEDTKTPLYRQAMLNFDEAIDAENAVNVKSSLEVLLKMLHPESSLRKILQIQAAPYMISDNDVGEE